MSLPPHLITQCPLCQGAYASECVQLMGEQKEMRLFHCACQHCGHAMLALLIESSGWVSSIGLMTDLKAKDAFLFQKLSPIASNDCVYVHQFLEASSQEFCRQLLSIKTKT